MVPFNLSLAAPSSASATAQVDGRFTWDTSGWTVSTGGGKATGGTSGGMTNGGGFGQLPQQLASAVDPYTPQAFGMQQAGNSPVMWLLLAGAAGFILLG